MLDSDLAKLYQVTTGNLNKAVKRRNILNINCNNKLKRKKNLKLNQPIG
ncbi:putative uncharacterized protein [Peptostreptococcus anaerobius CAG:621]|nr:putative uncharacterized protein [Peptostreptococcus anaerobius CAG:621]